MSLSNDERFNLELLKLLLQVAWADGDVDDHEAMALLGLGRSWSVAEGTLDELRERLTRGDALPQPDLSLLRSRADDAMEAVRAMVFADGKLKRDEGALVKKIAALLGAK